tara:strand:- start:45 stop:830 length:786 start_codon:yes stop_codon:yes gene_type:complete
MGGYIGSNIGTIANAAERKQTYSITTATTSLTGLAYTPTKVHVFHNGVRLVDGTDYTATNGTSITLTNAAQNGDEVVVISYPSFQTSDTVSAANGGTFAGNVDFSGNVTVDGSLSASGHVLQAVHSTGTTKVTQTSNSTWVDANPTVTITPTSSSSKILLSFTFQVSTDTSGLGEDFRLLRDSTELSWRTNVVKAEGVSSSQMETITLTYFDTPSTTSSVVYKWQFKHRGTNTGTFILNDDTGGTSSKDVVSTGYALEIGQ